MATKKTGLFAAIRNWFRPKPTERKIFWGDFRKKLPLRKVRERHFMIMGATGSGKSTVIHTILHDIVPYILPGSNQRLIIYDPKPEFASNIYAIKDSGVDLILMHPHDKRAYAWDIAADVAHENDAMGIAATLVPEPTGTDDAAMFFNKMSRGLITHTLLGLKSILKQDWTFTDFVYVMLNPDLRRKVIATRQHGRELLADLGSDRTADNIQADVRGRFEGLRRLSDYMHQHVMDGKSVSLKNWVKTEGILVLGADTEPSSMLNELNRTVMTRLQAILLNRDLNPPKEGDDSPFNTAIIIDEFAKFSNHEALSTTLLEGRWLGIFALLAFQTRHSLVSAFKTEANVETLTSQLGNKMILAVEDPKDTKWAAELLGPKEASTEKNVAADEPWNKERQTKKVGGARVLDTIISEKDIRNIKSDGRISGFTRDIIDQHAEPFNIREKFFQPYWEPEKLPDGRKKWLPTQFFEDDWEAPEWDSTKIENALGANDEHEEDDFGPDDIKSFRDD